MGLRPTRGNENYRRPRESGDPLSVQWIPACAGMTRLSGEPTQALNVATFALPDSTGCPAQTVLPRAQI